MMPLQPVNSVLNSVLTLFICFFVSLLVFNPVLHSHKAEVQHISFSETAFLSKTFLAKIKIIISPN